MQMTVEDYSKLIKVAFGQASPSAASCADPCIAAESAKAISRPQAVCAVAHPPSEDVELVEAFLQFILTNERYQANLKYRGNHIDNCPCHSLEELVSVAQICVQEDVVLCDRLKRIAAAAQNNVMYSPEALYTALSVSLKHVLVLNTGSSDRLD